MRPVIRRATPDDASQWLELLQDALGEALPDRQIYSLDWVQSELGSAEQETYVAELDGQIHASISFLAPLAVNANPIANLGRFFVQADSSAPACAEALLTRVTEDTLQRGQILVSRVLAPDHFQQALHERLGFVCVGYQPAKHQTKSREGALFYVRIQQPERYTRLPLSDALPQIRELAGKVLDQFCLPNPATVRDGVVGYPLHTEIVFHDASYEDFELWRAQAQAVNPPVEVSGTFNMGWGYLRSTPDAPFRAILAHREDKVTAALAYTFDPYDRCMRLVQAFSLDDLSTGALMRQALKIAQEQLSAVYIEMDVLMTAPRLLKSAEQLGFVPIAYLPAFYNRESAYADVVKLVKLNLVYNLEAAPFTTHAQAIATIVDQNFQNQKVGVAIINLLRALPIFDGLGDGELRKIARLFTQKLYRPGETIFRKGDSSNEAYVVMRGEIDIKLDEASAPIAAITNGQIFGELAFLDGAARVALAIARQASIVLVIQRAAFHSLAQTEPHLGMVVMRNIAIELSNRLRKTNAAIATRK